MTDGVVFDASAVLAVARRELGADKLLGLRDRALLSAVNAAEVYAKLLAAGLSEPQITDGLRAIVRRVVPFDDAQGRLAGAMHAATRPHGLSWAIVLASPSAALAGWWCTPPTAPGPGWTWALLSS